MFAVDTDHVTILQLSALHMAGQPISDRLTFCFGTGRSKVRGHATSSFGPEMCGRDLMLHYSSDAGVVGCPHGCSSGLRISGISRVHGRLGCCGINNIIIENSISRFLP